MSLPIELTDKIIDEACAELPAWPFERAISLKLESSLALVSQSFRRRTNNYRFAHISLIDCDFRAPMSSWVDKFLPILEADVWTQDTGVARHVRKVEFCIGFNLYPNRSQRDKVEHDPGLFADGRIQKILNIISRGMKHGKSSAWTLLLTSHNCNHGHHLPMTKRKMKWGKINPAFLITLESLLKGNAYLTCLELGGFSDIPHTLLATSQITHLSLRDVTFRVFKEPSTMSGSGLGQLQYLEVLELKCESFPNFIGIGEAQFRCLKRITIHGDVANFDTGKNVSSMLIVIRPNVPPNCDLEVSFHYVKAESLRDIENFYTVLNSCRFEYSAIDNFLDDYSRSSHSAVILRFNAVFFSEHRRNQVWEFQNFLEDGQHFLQEFFPLMHKVPRRKVFNIQTLEEMMKINGVTTREEVYEVNFSVMYI